MNSPLQYLLWVCFILESEELSSQSQHFCFWSAHPDVVPCRQVARLLWPDLVVMISTTPSLESSRSYLSHGARSVTRSVRLSFYFTGQLEDMAVLRHFVLVWQNRIVTVHCEEAPTILVGSIGSNGRVPSVTSVCTQMARERRQVNSWGSCLFGTRQHKYPNKQKQLFKCDTINPGLHIQVSKQGNWQKLEWEWVRELWKHGAGASVMNGEGGWLQNMRSHVMLKGGQTCRILKNTSWSKYFEEKHY